MPTEEKMRARDKGEQSDAVKREARIAIDGTPVSAEPTETVDELLTRVEKEETKASGRLRAIGELGEKLALEGSNVRKLVTYTTMTVFAVSSVGSLIALIWCYFGAKSICGNLVEDMVHIFQGVSLPVVTLVLGYYFGAASRGGNE